MADEIENLNENQDSQNKESNLSNDQLEKLLTERLSEQLKPIKEKLDKAYSVRDEALKKVAEYEKEKRDAELKRLEEEGKHKEAYEIKLAEINAAKETAEKRVIELTRDMEVRNSLISYNFRNENALEMAFKEIIGQLMRNENGQWIHRSGVSIKDYVKTFSENDDNAFLFKAKVNQGGGSQSTSNIPSGDTEKKSLFSLSQEEVLKLAAEGKLTKR